jgi:hypothetical protein
MRCAVGCAHAAVSLRANQRLAPAAVIFRMEEPYSAQWALMLQKFENRARESGLAKAEGRP